MKTFGIALLAAALPLAAAPAPTPAPPGEPAPLAEEISVSLLSFRARVVDASGAPLAHLEPKDFRVRAGDKAIPVLAVDYVERSVSPADSADPELPIDPEGDPNVLQASMQGQLFVVFVEAVPRESEHHGPRLNPIAGRGRIPAALQRLVSGLPPDARLAVVAHGAGLVPVFDFSRDREAAWQAVVRALDGRAEPPSAPAEGGLSLVAALDTPTARAATSPEQALALTAEALAPLPGEKTLLYVGMGTGAFHLARPSPSPEIEELLATLARARATVFVVSRLGLISPGSRQALGLLSGSTGGSWAASEKEIDRLARTLAGYYVVSLDAGALAEADGGTPITVELSGRKGTILMAPLTPFKAYL